MPAIPRDRQRATLGRGPLCLFGRAYWCNSPPKNTLILSPRLFDWHLLQFLQLSGEATEGPLGRRNHCPALSGQPAAFVSLGGSFRSIRKSSSVIVSSVKPQSM